MTVAVKSSEYTTTPAKAGVAPQDYFVLGSRFLRFSISFSKKRKVTTAAGRLITVVAIHSRMFIFPFKGQPKAYLSSERLYPKQPSFVNMYTTFLAHPDPDGQISAKCNTMAVNLNIW